MNNERKLIGSKPGPIHKLYNEDENRTTAVCKICGAYLNTTHGHILKKHFMKCYEKNQNKELDALIQEVLVSIKETPCRKRRKIMKEEASLGLETNTLSKFSMPIPAPLPEQYIQINKEGILRDITLLLTKYDLNDTFVEDPLFNHLLSSLNSNYTSITHSTIERKRDQIIKKNNTNIEVILKSNMIKYLCIERWINSKSQEFITFYLIVPQLGKLCYKLIEGENVYIYIIIIII